MDFLFVQFHSTIKLEKILFGNSSNLIQQIGEHSLFRSVEYLEKLINNS